MNIIFRELSDRAKKEFFMMEFSKEYFGEVVALPEGLFGPRSKFICAHEENAELGFVRITNYTGKYPQFNGHTLFSISDGYVKPEHRERGVLRSLINYSTEYQNARMLLIDKFLYTFNLSYYQSLGYVCAVGHETNEDLIWVFHKEFAENHFKFWGYKHSK